MITPQNFYAVLGFGSSVDYTWLEVGPIGVNQVTTVDPFEPPTPPVPPGVTFDIVMDSVPGVRVWTLADWTLLTLP